MVKAFSLSDEELRKAGDVIRRAVPGRYTLLELYGPDWDTIDIPTTFGRRFKAAVNKGQLPRITVFPERTSANAVQYDVYK